MQLTEEQMEVIAEKAANKAVDKMKKLIYQDIGETIVLKLIKPVCYLIGVIAVGVGMYLYTKGWLK